MRRGLLLLVGVIVLALAPALACAQISGLPSLGGFIGSSSGPGAAAAVYLGWMPGQENAVGASLDARNAGAYNIRSINFKYQTSGLWLGGALPIQITDKLSFLGTGWYLFPSSGKAYLRQSLYGVVGFTDGEHDPVPIFGTSNLGNDWTRKDIWWFVDGAVVYGDSNFAAIAGFRYDKFSTNVSSANINFDNGQQSDLISQAFIPLIGVQAGFKNSASALNVRAVGFPTMLGNAKANYTIDATNRFEATGTYNGGHFLEFLAEYSRQLFSNGDAGVFLRWNTTRVTSNANATTTLAPTTDDYLLSFNRNTWTFGGKVGLSF